MKLNPILPLLLLSVAIGSGCQTPSYRLTQPAGSAQGVGNQPVAVHQDPLEYRFVRHEGRLGMQVFNPTDDYIMLLGKESYVVDPSGQTHRFGTVVMVPHSVCGTFLPPVQSVYHATDPSIGNSFGVGFFSHYEDFYYPFHAGYYDDLNPGPGAPYARIATAGKWGWKAGPARLHLSYQRNGKIFDHNFEFARDRES